jgi:DNA primase
MRWKKVRQFKPKTGIIERVVGLYHHSLKADRDACPIVVEHNISKAMINSFNLGYANGHLKDVIPMEGSVIRALQNAGLLDNMNNEVFVGHLIVPIYNTNAQLINIWGIDANGQSARYLNEDNKGIFNIQALKVSREVVLCESIVSALTLLHRNVNTVISTPSFDRGVLRVFERCLLNEVVVVGFDDIDVSNIFTDIHIKRYTDDELHKIA